jgi:hypothetical protein
MNPALDHYQDNPQILSISGYSSIIKGLDINEMCYTAKSSSCGWDCWEKRWNKIDWQSHSYKDFKTDSQVKSRFNKMGSDMCLMMKRKMQETINSCDIHFDFHKFLQGACTIYPVYALVDNIGFGSQGESITFGYNGHKTILALIIFCAI